jgi:hypothetical protein
MVNKLGDQRAAATRDTSGASWGMPHLFDFECAFLTI